MSENKVKLSLTLSADNRAQMQALSIFASALALGEPTEAPAAKEAPKKTLANDEATVTTTEAAPVVNLTEEEKPKRKRRTAAEMKADNGPESEAAEVAESAPAEVESEENYLAKAYAKLDEVDGTNGHDAPAPKNPPTASKITLDDVRRAVADKKEKHLQIMKFKLKEDFGVSKTPDLAPHQYEAFYNFLQSLD